MEMVRLVGGVELFVKHAEAEVMASALALYGDALRNIGETFLTHDAKPAATRMFNRARYAEQMANKITYTEGI